MIFTQTVTTYSFAIIIFFFLNKPWKYIRLYTKNLIIIRNDLITVQLFFGIYLTREVKKREFSIFFDIKNSTLTLSCTNEKLFFFFFNFITTLKKNWLYNYLNLANINKISNAHIHVHVTRYQRTFFFSLKNTHMWLYRINLFFPLRHNNV